MVSRPAAAMMRRVAPQGATPEPPPDDDALTKPSGPQVAGPDAAAPDSDPDEFESAVEEQELPFNVNSMSLLSKGGFGAAYYARLKNGLPVVVKVARVGEDGPRGVANSEVWDAFETELTFYEAMSDGGGRAWLPEYFGTGLLNGAPWLVLERLGSSLHVLNGNREGARLFRRLALGMLAALQGLHAEGYIHRDVKLENFCVRQTRVAPLQVCLIDFGLAMEYIKDEGDFKEDAFEPFLGTYNYASDRQIQEVTLGRADDVECLGYALLELYQGKPWWKIFKTAKKAAPAPAPDGGKKRARGGEAAAPAKDPGTIVGSTNPRPRRQARGYGEPTVAEAAIRLVPPGGGASSFVGPGSVPKTKPLSAASTEPAPPAPTVQAGGGTGGGGTAAAAPSSLRHLRTTHMTACERFHATVKLRNAVLTRLERQGAMPQFLADWMAYAKDLSAFDAPNYAFLRSLLEGAPEAAPRAAAAAPEAAPEKAQQQRRAEAAMCDEE